MANENIDLKLNIDSISGLKSVGTMRKELKAMQIELQELETTANKALAMGDEATAAKAKSQHAERTKQFAELKNDLKDTAAAQKYLDPGELLGGYVKLAQGAVGAFGAVTAGLKLMGSENEIVNEITEKSATVIQFMMGLEQARQLLIDAGGVKQIAVLVKTTALQLASVAASTAQTVATGALTAAQWLLNIALNANPIGLVVLGVAGLIAGFWALYEATGSVTEALLWMINPMGMLVGLLYDNYKAEQLNNEEKEKSVKAAEEQVAIQEKVVDQVKKEIAASEKKLGRMKAQGATEAEIWAQTKFILEQRIQLAKEEDDLAEKNFIAASKRGDVGFSDLKRLFEAKQKVYEKEGDLAKANEAKEDERIAENRRKAERAREKKLEDEKSYQKRLKDIEDNAKINAIEDDTARQIAKLKLDSDREIAALNVKAKNYLEIKAAIEKETADEIAKIQKEATAKEKEESKKRLDDYNKTLKEKAANEKEIADKIRKLNTDLADRILQEKARIEGEEGRSYEYRLKLANKANNEEIAALEEHYKKGEISLAKYLERKQQLLNNNAANEDALRQLQKEKDIESFTDMVQSVGDVLNFVNDVYSQKSEERLAKLDEDYSRQQTALQTSLDNGIITQEQYDDKLEALTKAKDAKVRAEKEKAWKRQHAVDIANAVAGAAIAVAQVFAKEPGELAIKSAAAAIAAGIATAQIGVIASQKMPKFEKGGFIGGRSHSMGGTLIEAEAGEFIVNKKSMSNPGFASIVSSINNAGNSAQVPNISSFTGNNTSTIVSTLDPSVIDQIVSRIVNIPVNVVESDITQTQRKVSTIESRSVI